MAARTYIKNVVEIYPYQNSLNKRMFLISNESMHITLRNMAANLIIEICSPVT